MAYKISNKAIIIESDGETILVAESFQYEDGITISNTEYTLSPTYISDYFPPLAGTKNTAGYSAGGGGGGLPPSNNTIDKFPFSTDANATDVGDVQKGGLGYAGVGAQSSENGYVMNNSFVTGGDIEKFPFSSDGNSTLVGDFSPSTGTYRSGTSSDTHGYSMNNGISTQIEKFSFSSNGNATTVGDTTQARYRGSSQSSSTHGYYAGGSGPDTGFVGGNVIDKMPFSSDGNSADVGDLLFGHFAGAGASSDTNGYVAGGANPPNPFYSNIIQKFPFSADANATDVGDLTTVTNGPAGQSSTTHGYASAGEASPAPINVIAKYSFSSDANATDVGDVTQARSQLTGVQV